ncbi:PilZ domain-containing protein [Paenibacillus agricola]|uniref:PilZ domain-containing protein n=1 Tax=Paenibacillus agricola TaxID=2716264 RepID=A0ABX0JGH4_9BACL|nr:PilZ domain-containing protein [Paenibacillus agricola]NHN33793.1 PilZ domain-containing protein [Paenibacillus agricola]
MVISKSSAAGINYEYTSEIFKNPSTVLIHSRTVVEKDNFVSTGLLTYAEGDILEVEIPEFKVFELGDSVKLTVYSAGGIFTFQSTVVAKDQGSLIIINPPQNRRRFIEKRSNPRVEVNEKGKIHALTSQDTNERLPLDDAIGLVIYNISISGLGFALKHDTDLGNSMVIEVELDLGFSMPCIAEILRREKIEEGYYYGARYVEIAADKANSLRAFVLKKQVELHFSNKKLDQIKRTFK